MRQLFPGTVLWVTQGCDPSELRYTRTAHIHASFLGSGGISNNSKVMQRECSLAEAPGISSGEVKQREGEFTPQGPECGGPWPRTRQRAEATWDPEAKQYHQQLAFPRARMDATLQRRGTQLEKKKRHEKMMGLSSPPPTQSQHSLKSALEKRLF